MRWFRNQASTATQCKVSILSYTLNQSWEWVAQKTPMATLVVSLGLGGWVSTEVLAPQIAQADTERVEISLESQPAETYQTMLSRAEAAALNAIQQSFNQDILMTNVSVMIMGQNQGAIAPVLSMDVNREQWLSNPDVQRWVTYFTAARSLLGFEGVATTTTGSGTATPNTLEQSENASPNTEAISDTPAAGTATPVSTPTQSTGTTFTQPGTAPTSTPSQIRDSSPNFLNRQQPDVAPIVPVVNMQNPIPSSVNSVPSGLTPANDSQTPLEGSPTRGGAIIDNPNY